jgi:P27 family predicted phage terminase small subunit
MPGGRPPLPTKVKAAKGTLRPCRQNVSEPVLPVEGPSCPRELSGLARREFMRARRELKAAGIVAKIDRGALVGYSVALALVLECQAEIAKTGAVIKGRLNNPILSPFAVARQMGLKSLATFVSALGMSPSSRARVHAAEPAAEPDEFDRFLYGARPRRPPADDGDERPLS